MNPIRSMPFWWRLALGGSIAVLTTIAYLAQETIGRRASGHRHHLLSWHRGHVLDEPAGAESTHDHHGHSVAGDEGRAYSQSRPGADTAASAEWRKNAGRTSPVWECGPIGRLPGDVDQCVDRGNVYLTFAHFSLPNRTRVIYHSIPHIRFQPHDPFDQRGIRGTRRPSRSSPARDEF